MQDSKIDNLDCTNRQKHIKNLDFPKGKCAFLVRNIKSKKGPVMDSTKATWAGGRERKKKSLKEKQQWSAENVVKTFFRLFPRISCWTFKIEHASLEKVCSNKKK